MIWQNVWAFAGLVALVMPVLIHLLSRKRASIERFPTLRFLPASRLLPTRATRISDWLLLLLRLSILAAVVAALAQPLVITANRRSTFNKSLARVVMVDTSASTGRLTPNLKRFVDSAEVVARTLVNESQSSMIVRVGNVREALPGAVTWLSMQPMRTELAVVSDFQQGTLDSVTVASIPKEIGIRLLPVAPLDLLRFEDAEPKSVTSNDAVQFSVSSQSSVATWAKPAATDSGRAGGLLLLSGVGESGRAMAAALAARSASPEAMGDSAHAVAIVFPEYEKRTEALVNVSPITDAWMGNAIVRMRGDSLLASAAENAVVVASTRDSVRAGSRDVVPPPYVALARNNSGRVVAFAARGNVDGRDRLLLFTLADAGSLSSAALIAAARSAVSVGPRPSEFDATAISNETLKGWEREAATQNPRARTTTNTDANHSLSGESDGRWLWVLALVLLGLEAWVRRDRAASALEAATR